MQKPLFIKGIIVFATLAALGIVFQQRYEPWRCSLDGSLIHPIYEVEILEADGTSRKFSCLRNAQIWLQRNARSARLIQVTDEITRKKIKAEEAFYVLSAVTTTAHTGNKVHVFASLEAAQSHAHEFEGVMVDNPLNLWGQEPPSCSICKPDASDTAGFACSFPFKPFCLGDDFLPESLEWITPVYGECLARFLEGHKKGPDKPPKLWV